MKKIILFVIAILFGANIASAQVIIDGKYTVENVELDTVPAYFNLLELFARQQDYKGLKVPALTQAGIDLLKADILAAPDSLSYQFYAKGLVVFNLDVNCMQIWKDTTFWSSCGGPKPAKAEIRNCSAARAYGLYIAGEPLTQGHYLSLPIWVEEKGFYEIMVIARRNGVNNGYFFATSGTFIADQREFAINIPVTGTPLNAETDSLIIYFNNVEMDCKPLVEVHAPDPDYTIVDVTVVPQPFPIETDLSDEMEYYATVKLRVNIPGEYKLTTSEVNGYVFSGEGEIEDASGFNPAGSFPQFVEVTVPVTGSALQYGTGIDHFTLGTLNAVNPSNFPFTVQLAGATFTIDCAGVTFSSEFNNIKTYNAIPSTAEITLPVNVTYAGSTIIKANFEDVEFSSVAPGTSNPAGTPSGTTKLNLGNQIIKLRPINSSQTPVDQGMWPVTYSSTLGGLMPWYCETDSVEVKPSFAQMSTLAFAHYHGTGEAAGTGGSATAPYPSKTTGGVYTVDPYISDDLTVQHPRDNPVTSITLTATVSIPGDYNYSLLLNGITYAASGTLTTTGSHTITLTPTGTLTDWNQKVVEDTIQWYKVGDTLGNPTGEMIVPMSFMYRAIVVLSLGSRDGTTYGDRPFGKNASGIVSAPSLEIWNENNFGPKENSTKFVGDFVVYNGVDDASQSATGAKRLYTDAHAGQLQSFINNQKPDIIFMMAGTDELTDSMTNVLARFVKETKGMLNISTYNYPASAALFNKIYDLSGTAAYSGSSTTTVNDGSATADFITYTWNTSYNNRIAPTAEDDILFMGGPFKPEAATWNNTDYKKFVADDCGDGTAVLINKLPPSVKVLAYRSGNSASTTNTNNYTTHAYMLRDTNLGFFWCGDYAWANGRPSSISDRAAWPNRADASGNLLPASAQPFGAASLTSSSASAIYNNIAFCNSFAWAIDYAAVNRVP